MTLKMKAVYHIYSRRRLIKKQILEIQSVYHIYIVGDEILNPAENQQDENQQDENQQDENQDQNQDEISITIKMENMNLQK